ncbi:biliverdin-producing heme oxygenase [Phenylobacterium immobile]|uniref:biliverdin-producing heme oxygenase n=1 Tax=Phenylobacterium immobile TaxID=21 RepID=UPI000B0E18B0|nr:biliverdin-producing heme oxygenase [Phenylobacterium immobile]
MTLIAELRAGTADAHQSLEQALDLFERIRTPAGRREVVGRFFGLHAGLEDALHPHLSQWPGLDFAVRRRTPHLERDVRSLGGDPTALRRHPWPSLKGPAEALGLFYVLEGSTLGGAVIEKQLKARGERLDGLSFLHPYGDQTGARWRTFMAVLDAAPADQSPSVVDGARLGFQCAETWLCRESAPV